MVENSDLEIWNLHRAARQNRVDIASALITRGDDVNASATIMIVMTIVMVAVARVMVAEK